MSENPLPQLRYLQPSQYRSWLKKANDPEWDEERFGCSTRSKPERAAATFALELRGAFDEIRRLREALEEAKAELMNCGFGPESTSIADIDAALASREKP